MDKRVLKEFQQIPGAGKNIAKYSWHISVRSIHDLNNNTPEHL